MLQFCMVLLVSTEPTHTSTLVSNANKEPDKNWYLLTFGQVFFGAS